MKIQVRRLREVVELLGPAVPRKTSLPITTNIWLGEGMAIATDLEVAATVSLPEAEDVFLLPYREVRELLRYAPGHEVAQISVEKGQAAITVGGMKAQFRSENPQDFPPIPSVKAEGEGVLDGDALLRALVAVEPYTATQDTRPVLTAICLTPGDEVAAADGFRLAWEKVPGKLAGANPLLIPSRAVSILAHLWKKCARPDMADISNPAQLAMAKRFIRLEWGKGLLQMNFGEAKLLVVMVQGNFPNYHQLIPTEPAPSVTVSVGDMERALHPLKAVAKERGRIVRLVWGADQLQLSAKDEEVGEARTQVRATCSEAGKTAININYLSSYLRGKEGFVTFSTASRSAPILFTYRGTPHVVMMPMFVQWDGEEPAKTPPPPAAAADTWTPETGDIPQDTPEVEPKAKETPRRRRKKG